MKSVLGRQLEVLPLCGFPVLSTPNILSILKKKVLPELTLFPVMYKMCTLMFLVNAVCMCHIDL